MVSCGVALGLLLLGELPVGTAGTLAAAWGRSASNNASTGTSAGRLEASEPKSKSKALLHPQSRLVCLDLLIKSGIGVPGAAVAPPSDTGATLNKLDLRERSTFAGTRLPAIEG